MATTLDVLYSKLSFRMSDDKRFEIYRKLASLLRNDFTLMDALWRIERIESKDGSKPNEPFAIVMREWQKNLERGQTLAEATSGWVPSSENLMLTLGDVSKLSVALENIVSVGEGASRIKSALLNAFAYPSFLMILTFLIIIMVGIYLVPPLQEAAGGDIVWHGTAASLVWLAKFSNDYWLWVCGVIMFILGTIWLSMSNWSGRVRTLFDYMPPWSMYKISASAGWLMSLAAIIGSGGSLPAAMKILSDNSTPYLRDILSRTSKFITNGDNLGRALANTGRHFPNDEIIGDLAIYADMNDFDINLQKLANTYLNESVRKMEKLSNFMNSVGILMVSAVIGWVVFGTFQMQEQITSMLS